MNANHFAGLLVKGQAEFLHCGHKFDEE